MRTFMTILAAAMLAACATPTEQADNMRREMDRKIAVYGPACDKLGFTANTDPWRNCVLQLNIEDEINNYAYYPYSTHRGFWGRY
ncbi:hypothetical protein AAKU55_002734 [Oxalobacteraceae bacterium GrIS 1.11]